MGKIFATGDIHGRLDKLEDLMDVVEADRNEDTLIFLGDYIDRGPDSAGVVDFILDLRETYRNIVCLRGNHEELFLDYVLKQKNRDLYFYNGGRYTLRSYGLDPDTPPSESDIPERHMAFFKSLPYYWETEDYIFVHAGLRPGIPLGRQDKDDMVWIRGEFIFARCDFGKTVIFGHTPFSVPFIEDRRIGIDTGAAYSGPLTCLELPAKKFHQV